MTTIAYSKGMLASDSRATKKAVIDDDTCKKIWRLSDGSLYGGAGDYVGVLKLLQILQATTKQAQKKKKKKDKTVVLPIVSDKCSALLVTSFGTWYYEAGFWEKLRVPFYAIGTGGPYAMVALECGKNAQEAVKFAKGKDIYSGGKVQCLKL